jgi:hypothetical protein
MPLHFWVWLLFLIVVIGGGWFGWRATTPEARAANPYWFAPNVFIWLLLFAICWAVAGNPVNALVR